MKSKKNVKYPGIPDAMDGNTAVIMCERESTDAAGAYPITPSTQMGEYWAAEAAKGHLNISGNPLIFIEPEGEHAAAAVTAGMAMSGLRATNFSSGQGVAYMHESLYAAVGKRLTYILNMGCRAITKASLNVHAGHDDYHSVDDSGFFQVFGKNVQQVADLNIIGHRIAELSLNPGIVAQDGFLTTHLIESLNVPERELIEEYLGRPDDIIDSPTPAQRLMYGKKRRRIPELWTIDNPVLSGPVQNQDSYMQTTVSQRPFFFDHIEGLAIQAMDEFYELTGRRYNLVETYKMEDADYVFLGQGSVIPNAEVVADYLRETRKLKIGVVNVTMFRPFPGKAFGTLLKGKKGVVVLERLDQPLAEDLPLIREVRSALNKCLENGHSGKKPYPDYESFSKLDDLPPLYSASFGLGSRDLQPEALIGAIENMLPDGPQRKMFYLSIDFIRDKAVTPKQEIYQQELLEAYPNLKQLAIRGSENPNLLPKNSIAVRIHSIGGWGAMATGKSLTMTLADILGFYIKSNPKYGSEKKGQPTTYYLSVAPEPIKVNCEYFFVDVVISPDPNVFQHSNPLAGLKKGGIFIIQSDLEEPVRVWRSIPKKFQEIIIKNEIKIYFLDAFTIAREEASDTEMQFRMQGIAFQGAFFAASPLRKNQNLSEEDLFKKIHEQLNAKFGSKGARIVDDNLRVVQRGYGAVKEITDKQILVESLIIKENLPVMLKILPASEEKTTDIHRYWEQIGYFYRVGLGNDILADPFASTGLIPASTGVFKDMTQIRFEYPEYISDNCTGCGNCWTVCPDSALPGLVNEVSEVFQTTIKRVEKSGVEIKHLRKVSRTLEKQLRQRIDQGTDKDSVKNNLEQAIDATISTFSGSDTEKKELITEFDAFKKQMNGFNFATTRPFYTLKEKEGKGSGGLLSITVNPYTCKGCMECVKVCGDDALRIKPQTEESISLLKDNWDYWLDLPTTQEKYIRIDNLEEGIGPLQNLLLDKNIYTSMVGGDGACLGCAEKTILHLFTSTVTALLQPRTKAHLEKIDDLVGRLEQLMKSKLSVNVGDTELLKKITDSIDKHDVTLSELSSKLDAEKQPIDIEWLHKITETISGLKKLKWQYTNGATGNGRSNMGIINATGCTSVWGATYPINPYPFPWSNHLFQDSPSMAMGVFEGHMKKMAEGFKLIRTAEYELTENPEEDLDLTYFTWRDFTRDELLLCPPVVAVGGDGAMYDIGFQNLSRMLMSGMPIKALVVDTQVYSNTGGQSCTSGFIGQISDMAEYGKVQQGKREIRKEMSFIGIAHRDAYVLQSSIATISHLLEGFIEGLMSPYPALFNIYSTCQPEHGIGDDMAVHQSKLALESRAYPIMKYNPAKGDTVQDCLNIDGNPDMDKDWPTYTLKYKEGEVEKSMEVSMTFADFAATEARFRKHFRAAPRETWDDEKMVLAADFVDMDKGEREGKFPYIWATNKKGQLARLIVSSNIIDSMKDRRNYWRMLKNLAGLDVEALDEGEIANKTRSEMIARLTQQFVKLSGVDPN